MSSSSLLLLILLVPTTVVWGQTCPAFVPIDATGIGSDFTKLILEPNCPVNTQTIPGQMHYLITTTTIVSTTAQALTLTASAADLVTPILTPRGLGIDLNDAWNDNDSGVGVEILIAGNVGRLAELELYGVRDQVLVTDTAGGLRQVLDEGDNNALTITTTRSGTLKYTHRGLVGVTVIDAPNAVLDIDISGLAHDLRIVSCQGLRGVITGSINRILVVSGEIMSLQVPGNENRILLHTDIPTENGCANVALEGQDNVCDDDIEEKAAVMGLGCVGLANYTVQCSETTSTFGGSAMIWATAVGTGLFLWNSIM